MYDDQWRGHDRRLAWLWATCGVGFATFIGLVILTSTGNFGPDIKKRLFGFWFVAWAVVWLFVWHRITHWPCPRCGKCFVAWYHLQPLDLIAIKPCAHCGLTRDSRKQELGRPVCDRPVVASSPIGTTHDEKR